jgi:hypothetical protein
MIDSVANFFDVKFGQSHVIFLGDDIILRTIQFKSDIE